MRSATRYLAILGAIGAALAIGCAESTAPRPSSDCSGGGTQGWEHCGPTIAVDTAAVRVP